MLEPFKTLDMSGDLPKQFKFFCNEAVSSANKAISNTTTDEDTLFHVCTSGFDTIIWRTDITTIEPAHIYSKFEGLHIKNDGFALSILDYALETPAPDQVQHMCWCFREVA